MEIVIIPILANNVNDIDKIIQLINRATLPRLHKEGLDEEIIKEILDKNTPEWLLSKINNGFFYVATDNKRIVGVIGIRKDEGSEIPNRLSSYFVDPEFQGKGIGRLLYNQVLAKAQELGCSKLVVSSSTTAEPIYAHFGFQKVKEIWKDHKNGHRSLNIWMEKSLK